MKIKFKPITRIRKTVKGKRVTLFYPSKTYEGDKYLNGDIFAHCPKLDKLVKINENDIMLM